MHEDGAVVLHVERAPCLDVSPFFLGWTVPISRSGARLLAQIDQVDQFRVLPRKPAGKRDVPRPPKHGRAIEDRTGHALLGRCSSYHLGEGTESGERDELAIGEQPTIRVAHQVDVIGSAACLDNPARRSHADADEGFGKSRVHAVGSQEYDLDSGQNGSEVANGCRKKVQRDVDRRNNHKFEKAACCRQHLGQSHGCIALVHLELGRNWPTILRLVVPVVGLPIEQLGHRVGNAHAAK